MLGPTPVFFFSSSEAVKTCRRREKIGGVGCREGEDHRSGATAGVCFGRPACVMSRVQYVYYQWRRVRRT